MNILKIDASARKENSQSRILTNRLVNQLKGLYGNVTIAERELPGQLPLMSDLIATAMHTPDTQRNALHKQALEVSDHAINELQDTDILVIGTPVYNFTIPATLKMYIDMIIRVGVTFKYTERGPVGLMKNIKTFVAVTSGGIALYSKEDFVSSYLRTALGFIGITDITFIDATQLNIKDPGGIMAGAFAAIDSVLI